MRKTAREFLKSKNVNDCDFQDSGMTDYIAQLLDEYLITNNCISNKILSTEMYVDATINKTGKPPTYRQVMKRFNLKSVNSSYVRLKRYRHKMKSRNESKN